VGRVCSFVEYTMIDNPIYHFNVFSYNALDRRASMTDGLGATSWSYNNPGRVLSVTDPNNNIVSYSYDAAGDRLSLSYPYARAVQYAYKCNEVARLWGKFWVPDR